VIATEASGSMVLVAAGPSSCEEQQHQPDSRAGLACAAAQARFQQGRANASFHFNALYLHVTQAVVEALLPVHCTALAALLLLV
jgi:hypothetical protein